jgi:hypothetical protein
LLAFRADQTYFGRGDFFVDALRLVLSDGSVLHKFKKSNRHAPAAFLLQQAFNQGFGSHLP